MPFLLSPLNSCGLALADRIELLDADSSTGPACQPTSAGWHFAMRETWQVSRRISSQRWGTISSAMGRPPLYPPEPTSAPGDFYVEDKCCVFCGVPQVVAPDLVEWVNGREIPHCRWKKQPSTPEELKQAFAIFDGQELGCHRYAGIDPAVQERIGFEN